MSPFITRMWSFNTMETIRRQLFFCCRADPPHLDGIVCDDSDKFRGHPLH